MPQSGRSAIPQKRLKRCERRQVGVGVGRQTHFAAGRSIKHPCRKLQPTIRIGAANRAAENKAIWPLDRHVNVDPKTKPRMPGVQQFPKFGSVGVLKPCCIIDTEPHSSLDGTTPDQAYFTQLPFRAAA